MRILDSSVLVAMYHESDVHHPLALELLKAIPENEPVLLNDFLVNEIAGVMLRKVGLAKAKEMLAVVIENQQFRIHHTSEEEFNAIVRAFKAQTSTLSFVDCSIIELAISEGCKVETFDKILADELKKREASERDARSSR